MSVDTLTSRQRETNSISVCLYLLYPNRWLIGSLLNRRSNTPFGNCLPSTISDAVVSIQPACYVPVVNRNSTVLIVNRSPNCGGGCINIATVRMYLYVYTWCIHAYALQHLHCCIGPLMVDVMNSNRSPRLAWGPRGRVTWPATTSVNYVCAAKISE